MLRLIIAYNYCIHIFIILFSIFFQASFSSIFPMLATIYAIITRAHRGWVLSKPKKYRCDKRWCTMLVYGCFPSSHFPSIAIDQCCAIRFVRLFSPETFICCTVDESTIHINPHMSRVYTRESDNVTTTKRPAFLYPSKSNAKDYR